MNHKVNSKRVLFSWGQLSKHNNNTEKDNTVETCFWMIKYIEFLMRDEREDGIN